jgi:sec-independent protein translocase protein TatB
MFDIGFLEMLVILVLALIVLGPERLPKAARTVGYWLGKARRYIEGMKAEVEREFDSSELKRMLHNQEVQIKELQNKLNDTEDYVNQDYHNMFENKDDPGTDMEQGYDIIEEDDDEYAALEETPKKSVDKPVEKPAEKLAEKEKPEQAPEEKQRTDESSKLAERSE